MGGEAWERQCGGGERARENERQDATDAQVER